MMVRKLAAAMLGVGVFIPGLANALGLGEIKLNSALSEPLDAEIELVQVRELTSTEILPALANSTEFQKAHIERFHFLTDLKFDVVVKPNGKSYIKVLSKKPVKEPFLNFLVEVNWPAGRLLREYTLLLDPPIYSQEKAQPVKQAQAAPSKVSAPKPTAKPVPTEPAYQAPSASNYTVAADQVKTHTIGSSDSLWAIAKQMKPSSRVSIQQTMMAIQRINPEAFIDGNINLLKKGKVLRAPSEEEAMVLSSREAIALAAEQNRLWKEKVSSRSGSADARQIDLSGRSVDRVQKPAEKTQPDRLKLVSGSSDNAGDSGQGGDGQSSGKLRDQLAAAEENVDKFRIEGDELKGRVQDLEDQIDTTEKVLTLKDEQIATLQAKLKQLEQEMQAQQLADKQAIAELAEAEVISAAEPADNASDTLDAEMETMAALEDAVEEEVDYNYQEDASESEPSVEASLPDTRMDEMPPQQSEEKPVVDVAPKPEAQSPADMVSMVMKNPMYLGGILAAIVALLAVALIALRRKKPADDFEDIDDNFTLPEAGSSDEIPEFDSINLEEDDAFEEAVEASVPEETVPQTSDVIGEADIYVAYGRLPQAIEMLEKAAQTEPDRSDIRLKLCEVACEADDGDVFMNHYRVLQNLGSDDEIRQAEEFRNKLGLFDEADAQSVDEPGDETVLSTPYDDEQDDFSVFESEAVSSEPIEHDKQSLDFDLTESDDEIESPVSLQEALDQESDTGLDFDLGDLEEADSEFVAGDEPSDFVSGDSTAEEVAGLDFDLNLSLDDEETESKPATDDTNTLAFDTDFSLDTVSTEDASPESANAEADEFSLDFDLSESQPENSPDLEGETPLAETEISADVDFDFDLGSDDQALIQSGDAVSSEDALSSGDDEPVLDSQSAAQLADELDLDMDISDLQGDSEVPSFDAIEDDLTVIDSPALDGDSNSMAANDQEDGDDELDFLTDADEASTKLDLARAYIDMGDRDGAKDILDEVVSEGNDGQKQEAQELLARLDS